MSVEYLPIWKRGASAQERFLELAQVAAKHPERFARVCVIYQEFAADGESTQTRYIGSDDITTIELLGLLAMCEHEIWDRVGG